MKPGDIDILETKIKSEIHSKYYIFGDEDYLKRRLISAIRAATVSPDFADFNVDEFWAGDLKDARPLFDALLAVPMMVGKRLVILREADKASKNIKEGLPGFKIPDSCVFVVESASPKKNDSFHKALAGIFASTQCDVGSEKEMIEWARFIAGEKSVKLDEKKARILVLKAGVNLDALDAELEKLALLTSTPTEKDIENLVASSRNANIFQLSDCYASRDSAGALLVAQKLFSFGESGTMMLSLLKNEAVALLRLKADPTSASLGNKAWKLRFYKECTAKWSAEDLRDAIISLADADYGIKKGYLTEIEAVVEALAICKAS